MAIERRVQIEEMDKSGEDDRDVGGDVPNREDIPQERLNQDGANTKMQGNPHQEKVDEQSLTEVDEINSTRTDDDGGGGGGGGNETDEKTRKDTTPRKEQSEDVTKNKFTTQSIDINIPQVEKDGTNGDDDDDDETQSVVMGTTKSVTFSIHPANLDDADVDDEIARVTMNKASDDQMSNFDVEVDYEGRAQTTNTPVTIVTEYQGVRKGLDDQREDIYEHAISVMRNRSSMTHYTQSQTTIKSNLSNASKAGSIASSKLSTKGLPIYPLSTVIARIQEPPLANRANCSFYVLQKRIHPVPPIKAWKGYDTNVYFEPMICRKAVISSHDGPRDYPQNMIQQAPPKSAQKTPKVSSELRLELPEINNTNQKAATVKTTSVKSVRIAKSAASVRTGSKSRLTTKSRASTSIPKSRPMTTSRQFAVLDKISVLDNIDSNIGEDIKWIDGLESTGTLQVGEPLRRTGSTTHVYTRDTGNKHYKMRICRGLVSHNLTGQFNSFPVPPSVSGGRIVDSPTKMEYLEKEYQGESHFLTNPHGMFASPVPVGSPYSSSPLPSLRRQSSAISNSHHASNSSDSNSRKQSVVSGK
ncbi:uncharacterized protein [Amphiura filiformis]|uniref:uncharacterized protein n=1 Tax=Amphiura filiformis TaxID=82378 RepID=UPI003B2229C7